MERRDRWEGGQTVSSNAVRDDLPAFIQTDKWNYEWSSYRCEIRTQGSCSCPSYLAQVLGSVLITLTCKGTIYFVSIIQREGSEKLS